MSPGGGATQAADAQLFALSPCASARVQGISWGCVFRHDMRHSIQQTLCPTGSYRSLVRLCPVSVLLHAAVILLGASARTRSKTTSAIVARKLLDWIAIMALRSRRCRPRLFWIVAQAAIAGTARVREPFCCRRRLRCQGWGQAFVECGQPH